MSDLLQADPLEEGDDAPCYGVARGSCAYVLSGDGDRILRYRRASVVRVPLVRLQNPAARIPKIMSLLVQTAAEERIPETVHSYEAALARMRIALTRAPYGLELAGVVASRWGGSKEPNVPVVTDDSVPSDVAFGLGEPEYLGVVARSPDGRVGFAIYNAAAIVPIRILAN